MKRDRESLLFPCSALNDAHCLCLSQLLLSGRVLLLLAAPFLELLA